MAIKWGLYKDALSVYGETRRDREIYEAQKAINKRANRSPAYKTVLIDGEEQKVVITSTANLYEKKINAMPNEHIYAGSIVEWNGRHFIIQYTDCEDEIYQRGIMQQCNIYLKWQNAEGEIIGRYGYSEDISMYATGVVTNKLLDSLELNFKINIPMDEETIKLRRGKRFLLDVISDEPNAYILTNRNVNSLNFHPENMDKDYKFNGKDKVMQITLSQTQLSDKDNRELMIADYFEVESNIPSLAGKCSIQYKGKCEVRLGGNFKTFSAEFYNNEGNVISGITPVWNVVTLPEIEKLINVEYINDTVKIKVPDDERLLHTQIKIELSDTDGIYYSEIYVKVVTLYGV